MAIRKDFAAATRPRNALATRAAILEAARACFTEAGYEHVGVRDVAARAGVNGALPRLWPAGSCSITSPTGGRSMASV
jgi:hypothetical protein